jgi:hypothetical protein
MRGARGLAPLCCKGSLIYDSLCSGLVAGSRGRPTGNSPVPSPSSLPTGHTPTWQFLTNICACAQHGPMTIDDHRGRPAQPRRARHGPDTKWPSLTQPDGLRAHAGRHYGLRSQPSTSPKLIFQAGSARWPDDGPACRWATCQLATRDQEVWRRCPATEEASGGGGGWPRWWPMVEASSGTGAASDGRKGGRRWRPTAEEASDGGGSVR